MSFQMSEPPFAAVERMSDGLRAYFGKIYNYMAGGLILSALTAYLTAHTSLIRLFYNISAEGVSYSLLGWVAILSPLALVFMIPASLARLNIARAQGLFWLFSALMGVSLSNIFLFFSDADIFQAFLVTAGMFAALSLYGYTTKRSLAGWGSFLFMGLIGVILASLLNLFFQSGPLNFGLSILAVLIFVGLTVYDTQRLKRAYDVVRMDEEKQALAISGALSLYLDFINLFRQMLYFLNNRR